MFVEAVVMEKLSSPALALETIVVAASGQVSADLSGETIILHGESGFYFGLEEVGAFIWDLVQEPQTLRAICEQVQAEYDVKTEDCQTDVLSLITELLDEGLVVCV